MTNRKIIILSINNSSSTFIKIEKDAVGVVKFTFSDGTNSISVNKSIAPYEEINPILDWGTHSTGQKMRLSVNDVVSSLANFSGSLGAEDLVFGYGSPIIQWIKKDSLKYFSRPRW